MKEKVNKDIIIRVGQGIMRIPKEKASDHYEKHIPASSRQQESCTSKKKKPSNQPHNT